MAEFADILGRSLAGVAQGRQSDEDIRLRQEVEQRMAEAQQKLLEMQEYEFLRKKGLDEATARLARGALQRTQEGLPLSPYLEAAVAAGGSGHHFRVLQVPMNLLETGAARQANTGSEAARTALEWAAGAGMAVLTNRPLNAYADGTLIRLADVPLDDTDGAPSPDEALPRVAALEEEFRLKIGARLHVPEGGPPPAEWFRWADQLRAMSGQLRGLDHWRRSKSR